MPRVTERLLDSVVYIYPDKEQAAVGASLGATGFLVAYPFQAQVVPPLGHLYLVTNSHVAKRDGRGRVARLNRRDGGVELVEISGSEWVHHDAADVAVVPLDVDHNVVRVASIQTTYFITRELLQDKTIREGDECLFIGRHYGLDGSGRNTPAVRMGSVAIAQPEPVYASWFDRQEESIAIEARSLSGYSGSPVFAWQSGTVHAPIFKGILGTDTPSFVDKWPAVVSGNIESLFGLLGITYGHMKGPNAQLEPGSIGDDSARALSLNSGIMLAVPAWRILEVLEDESLAQMRRDDEASEQ